MRVPDQVDHYARLHEAFDACRRLDSPERERYVVRLRETDPHLARDLSRLLESDVAGGAPIESGVGPAQWLPLAAGAANAAPPEHVGPYHIVRELGSGGMGTVYEAEQTSPRRNVALKLIRPGLAHGEVLRRFRREGEVLARLQHPGIAQVFEVGTTHLGGGEQPYLVMELVAGVPLLVHARREKLDRRARLELLVEVCDAIQHAHERGVVHRDLKPDNVLVDEEGRAKALDFGIARVRADESPFTTVHTAQGEIVGTLTHMAPEQLGGDPDAVGPAADVYALGVMAFELLTGRLPHEVAGLSITQAVQRITESEAPRLGSLDRDLRGDVETIVGKALEQEPERRYVSAAALASDVRRFLAHEPIAARRPSLVYRATRFTRRNPALVGGVAATVLALAAGATGILIYAKETADALARLELAVFDTQKVYADVRRDLDAGDAWSARSRLDAVPEGSRAWEWHWLTRRAPWVEDWLAGYMAFDGYTVAGVPARADQHPVVVDLEHPASPTTLEDVTLRASLSFQRRAGLPAVGSLAAFHGEPMSGLAILRPREVEAFECGLTNPVARAMSKKGGILLHEGSPGRAHGTGEIYFTHVDELRANVPLRRVVVEPSLGHGYCRFDLHPDETLFSACLFPGGTLELRSLEDGALVAEREGAQGQTDAAFDARGERIAFAFDGKVELLSVPDLSPLASYDVPAGDSTWIRWAEGDHELTFGVSSVGIYRIDLASGDLRQLVRSEDGFGGSLGGMSADGRFVVDSNRQGRALVVEVGAPEPDEFVELAGSEGLAVSFTVAGDWIVSGRDADGDRRIWDAWTGAELARLTEAEARACGPLLEPAPPPSRPAALPDDARAWSPVAFAPDESTFAVGMKGRVLVLQADGGPPLAAALEVRSLAHIDYRALAWGPGGDRLAVGGSNGDVYLLDTQVFRTQVRLPAHDGAVTGLAWSSDATRLLAAAEAGPARLYDSVLPIPRRLQAESRERRTAEQARRLEHLVDELGDVRAAVDALLGEVSEDEKALVAARRAALLHWATATDRNDE